MLDITNIPPPRVPLIDERSGLMSREWYRFFLNLFRLTGGGTNDLTLSDLQLAPQAQVDFGDLNDSYDQAQLSYLPEQINSLQSELNSLKLGEVTYLDSYADFMQSEVDALKVSQSAYPNACIEQMQSDLNGLKMAPKPLETHPIPYGAFFDTTTQTGSTTTATTITFNSTDITSGVYVGAPTSRIYVNEAGVYNFQFSLQLENTTSTQGDVNIWFRVNGTDAAGSNGLVWVPGKHAGGDGHIIIGWNFFVPLAAGNYVELVWLPSATTITIKNYASVVGPPAIPSTYSAILTAFKVNLTTG
jgi:hypothetical protein